MAKLILMIAGIMLVILMSSRIECRSLPAAEGGEQLLSSQNDDNKNINENPERVERVRRSLKREVGTLLPVTDDIDVIENKVLKTVDNGILCNVENALPGRRVPCKDDNSYEVEWSPVSNGAAANINVYRTKIGIVNQY